VKTTIEISDELFKRAKATAAMEGESLRELICDAIESRLDSASPPRTSQSGWRSVFGLAGPKSVAKIDVVLAADVERVDPSEWR
jgi:hypothetical protein